MAFAKGCGPVQAAPSSVPVAPKAANASPPELIGQRLPKSHLVRKGWEYQRVYDGGKRVHGTGFSLIILDNGLAWNRLGISIHRRLRGAVKRNRLKRIIRESFRRNRTLFPPSADIVITVRSDFTLNHPEEICSAVQRLLKQGAPV